MIKTLVWVGAILLIGAFFIAITAGTGASASPADEITITLDKVVNLSNNLTVYISQVTISNITYGGAYSPDPANTVWPILVFRYENHGRYQAACRLHVQFVDNESKVYDKTDITIPQPLYPNQVSTNMTLEMAMPNNRILSKVIIVDDGLKIKIAEFAIVYPTPTPEPTATPAPITALSEGDNLRNLLLIPIFLGIVGLIGWFMARNRLF